MGKDANTMVAHSQSWVVQSCGARHRNQLHNFSAAGRLKFLEIDILDQFSNTKRRYLQLVDLTDCYTELTRAIRVSIVALTSTLTVFADICIISYSIPTNLLIILWIHFIWIDLDVPMRPCWLLFMVSRILLSQFSHFFCILFCITSFSPHFLFFCILVPVSIMHYSSFTRKIFFPYYFFQWFNAAYSFFHYWRQLQYLLFIKIITSSIFSLLSVLIFLKLP